MSSLIVDRKDLNEVIHDMRYYIAHACNASDDSEKARCFVKAEAIYNVLDSLDLLNESQKVNYLADITELYNLF